MIYLLAYLLTIPAANWFIGNVGDCSHAPPCLIPLGFGLMAPSGVLWIGVAFSLRDAVHERLGAAWALVAIVVGAVLSLLVADPFVALASATAFLLSELGDFLVYAPLRARGFVRAVVASNLVGSVIDSAAFLLIAFGSLDFIFGQVVGKWLMIVPAVVLLAAVRRYRDLPVSDQQAAHG